MTEELEQFPGVELDALGAVLDAALAKLPIGSGGAHVGATPNPPPLPPMSSEPCADCGRLGELHRNYGGPLGHDYKPQAPIVRAPS